MRAECSLPMKRESVTASSGVAAGMAAAFYAFSLGSARRSAPAAGV